MNEVINLQELKNIIGNYNGELYYVKGHTSEGDGGGGVFMWRTDSVFITGDYQDDNNGTILKTSQSSGWNLGRWVRQYEGYINVLYFGAFGRTQDYTTPFQNAIDFASLNALYSDLKGSVVYVPNGDYRINTLLLKNGVSLLGESTDKTLIQTTENHTVDYMFKIEDGPVFINISNFKIYGRNETDAGCFLFEAKPILTPPYHGGLWNSTFNNIQIYGFKGHGIYLKGGSSGLLPNQVNIFENVRVGKVSDFSNALKMVGQNGQHSFINCTFDGFYNSTDNSFAKGHNVNISPDNGTTTAILSFINCTFQQGDYGIYLNYAENINIDTCWFESLGVAITVNGSEYNSCRDITIQNNRFANAAGYGSLNAPNNIKAGQCISVTNSFVNVYNNYVVVSDPNGSDLNSDSSFVLAYDNELGGVSVADNVFQVNELGKTFIMQVINVAASNEIFCGRNKLIFVNSSITVIKSIISSICTSETITIRANGGTIEFDNTGNIFLANKTSLILNNGEVAVFMRIDTYTEIYQLISIIRSSTP